jgi:hypothetical protein
MLHRHLREIEQEDRPLLPKAGTPREAMVILTDLNREGGNERASVSNL